MYIYIYEVLIHLITGRGGYSPNAGFFFRSSICSGIIYRYETNHTPRHNQTKHETINRHFSGVVPSPTYHYHDIVYILRIWYYRRRKVISQLVSIDFCFVQLRATGDVKFTSGTTTTAYRTKKVCGDGRVWSACHPVTYRPIDINNSRLLYNIFQIGNIHSSITYSGIIYLLHMYIWYICAICISMIWYTE